MSYSFIISFFNSTEHFTLPRKQTSCPRPRLRQAKSGHCSLPESFSDQPLPFGILCLIMILLQRHWGLLCEEFLVPLHVFFGEAAKDLSGAPQTARKGEKKVGFKLTTAQMRGTPKLPPFLQRASCCSPSSRLWGKPYSGTG